MKVLAHPYLSSCKRNFKKKFIITKPTMVKPAIGYNDLEKNPQKMIKKLSVLCCAKNKKWYP